MPFVPRPAIPAVCAHCQTAFASRHLRRKYCSSSCNVLATQARKKAGIAPVDGPVSPAAEFALPTRFVAAVGPVEPVGSYFFISSDERSWGAEFFETAHCFQAAQRVPWLANNGEYFPRSEFAVDTRGTVWLQAYGFDQRWFRVATIEGLEAA